ncbi:MAG: hypothetical protein M5T61_21320 [Acidimicrobiia bacterium]|nr:hypothetical protein [Acidimicrobiia bacterium]
MPVKTPDRTTSDYATWVIAAADLAAQFTGMSDAAKDNVTTIALAVSGFLVAGDTMRRFGRASTYPRSSETATKTGSPTGRRTHRSPGSSRSAASGWQPRT